MEIKWLRPSQPEREIALLRAMGYRMVYPQPEEDPSEDYEDYYSKLGSNLSITLPCVILKNENIILIIEL